VAPTGWVAMHKWTVRDVVGEPQSWANRTVVVADAVVRDAITGVLRPGMNLHEAIGEGV